MTAPPDEDEPAPDGAACDGARQAFAARWAAAVIGSSYVSLGPRGLSSYLLDLTDRLVELVRQPSFNPMPAHRMGAELVAAHFTGTQTLSRSLAVLGEELPALVGRPTPPQLPRRIAVTLGELAAGYASELRELTRSEQELIHRAAQSAQRVTEQRLAVSEARFRAMFDGAAIGIGIGDMAGNILQANPALLTSLGFSEEQFTQRSVADMMHPDDVPSVWSSYERLVSGQIDHFQVEKRFFRADGEAIWTNLTVSLVRDEQGEPVYQIAMMEDISERRQLQSSLEYLAYHDPLTGLPNRTLFAQRLGEVFAEPAATRRVGVCFLDLDGFKTVNDSLGHEVGDQLLIAVAERLSGLVGNCRLVARMGGDEFVILLENTVAVDEVVELAGEILDALRAPFRLGHHELRITASIGIVEKATVATTAADLLSAADITLYWAKNDGKARLAVYDRVRTDKEITRFTLASAMPAAIEQGEFVVYYQPLVVLTDGTMRGVEALLRWQHPTYGLLAPDRFIALAEETGAIVPLGRWVLSRACQQARAWRDEFGDRAPYVSVNLAPRQLQEPGLVADVIEILASTGLAPQQLQLELTEQAVMPDNPGPMQALHALNRMGIRLAVDDFGTGYSNLSYLRQLPVHELKMDGSFVRGLRMVDRADPTDQLLVSTLIDLAHGLNLTVTAEGVETDAQFRVLRALGCDGGQGWLFAAPGPPDEIGAVLRSGVPLVGGRRGRPSRQVAS